MLFLNDGTEILPVTNYIDLFLNKSTILYGTAGSGKSVLIKDIIYRLKDHIPNIIVFDKTNKLNQTYSNYLPNTIIFESLTEKLFLNIYRKQVELVTSNQHNLESNDFNLLLIFDDCYEDLQKFNKLKEFRELFFMGKHFKFTIILSTYYDFVVMPEIRNNVYNHIFADKYSASSFFHRNSNNITIEEKKIFNQYITTIFSNTNNNENYYKCFYSRSETPKIKYIIAK